MTTLGYQQLLLGRKNKLLPVPALRQKKEALSIGAWGEGDLMPQM